MSTGAKNLHSVAAFTLIELVLVMFLLATLLAISAPSLARSFHGRNLEQEAVQFLAATEYARSEAISQGVPMNVWIDPSNNLFGVAPKDGYSGTESRTKTWALHPEVRFDTIPTATDGNGHAIAAAFQPDGTLDLGSIEEIRFLHRSGDAMRLAQTEDRGGYEITKP